MKLLYVIMLLKIIERCAVKRIAIIGSSGAGKSTLARQLGSLLAIPVIHLDKLFWQSGWIQTPRDEWNTLQKQFVEQERWIMDGNYRSSLDMRLVAADTIIFLDFPVLLCLYRVLKRRFQYAGKSRPDMNEGCPERIDWGHVKWIWNYPRDGRVSAIQKIQKYSSGREIIILRNPKRVKQFLQEVRKRVNTA